MHFGILSDFGEGVEMVCFGTEQQVREHIITYLTTCMSESRINSLKAKHPNPDNFWRALNDKLVYDPDWPSLVMGEVKEGMKTYG